MHPLNSASKVCNWCVAEYDYCIRRSDILGRPSPPEGPLEVNDVTAEGCNLKWKPPKDDGGAPVRAYIVEILDKSGEWKKLAEVKDPKYKVKDLKEQEEYKYRVKAVNEVGVSEPLSSAPMVAKNPYGECMVLRVILFSARSGHACTAISTLSALSRWISVLAPR